MINFRTAFFQIAILLCINGFISCKNDQKSETEIKSDSLATNIADSVSLDSSAAASAVSNFSNALDSIYQSSGKNVLQALLTGHDRARKNTGFVMNSAFDIPDSLARKKPFLILTDIDLPQSPEKIFDMRESMFVQMASPACILNQNLVAVMEYAVNYSGTKVIIILANGNSRIIGAACDNVQTDNFGAINQDLAKAMNTTQEFADRSSANKNYISQIAQNQASISRNQILSLSTSLKNLESAGKIVIKSAIYSTDGSVKLLD